MKDLYNENLDVVQKEIEEHTRRCKDLLCLCIVRVNIVKMAILQKLNQHVQRNPHQNSNAIPHRNWKNNLIYEP